MSKKALFIAATGQHVGKTTTCLGLLSCLKKRFSKVGFMKPVGQEHVEVDNVLVDKDVLLFKNHFLLNDAFIDMSPVLFPRGFTRDYLDGVICQHELTKRIHTSYNRIKDNNQFTIVEGTGHTGVGSIVNLNNAQVAAKLGLNMILIASGGLGSSFDELSLNKIQCEQYGVNIVGVILNRVLANKREMILHYMKKALNSWNIPLIGCIPYNEFLSTPSMEDFEELFNTKLLSGEEHRFRHFGKTRLIAASVEIYRALMEQNQLIITPASREDIIFATLTKYWDHKISFPNQELCNGMILTGAKKPRDKIIELLKKAHIPTLYCPESSFETMKKINTYTAKIHNDDLAKVRKAIDVVEEHIDFDALEALLRS